MAEKTLSEIQKSTDMQELIALIEILSTQKIPQNKPKLN